MACACSLVITMFFAAKLDTSLLAEGAGGPAMMDTNSSEDTVIPIVER
jgi:hypothetical protein